MTKVPTRIKERDDVGRTALIWAIREGHGGSRESIVSLLIEKGGVNLCTARTNGGGTALMAAAYHGRESIARQLLGVVPDGLYVKLCGINKRAYDEI